MGHANTRPATEINGVKSDRWEKKYIKFFGLKEMKKGK